MATKAELEGASILYREYASQVRKAIAAGEVLTALRTAERSWPHVAHMLQYAKKYEFRQVETVETIDLALRYAPVLFLDDCLAELSRQLRVQKSILKNDSTDLLFRLEESRQRLRDAQRLWSHLEAHQDFLQSELHTTFGGDQEWWRWLAATWAEMGFVQRTNHGRSYLLSLDFDSDAPTAAKCTSCGVVVTAPKQILWGEIACRHCERTVPFVLLHADAPSC